MSGQEEGTQIDLGTVRDSAEAADSGVPYAVELVAFVDSFDSSENTPGLGAVTRLASKVMSPFAKSIFRKPSK